MKIKKFFVLSLTVAISLFMVSCGGYSIKESSENAVENEQEDDEVKQYTEEDTKQDEIEDEYYIIIKEAWQKQVDYIDSIDDPKVKQSVQTPESAAIMESNRLLVEHSEDYEAIDESLKNVLNGE